MYVDGVHGSACRRAAVIEIQLLEEVKQMRIGLLQGVEGLGSGLVPPPVKGSPTPFRRADQEMDQTIACVVNETDGFGASDFLLSGTRFHKVPAMHGGITVISRTVRMAFESPVAPILPS